MRQYEKEIKNWQSKQIIDCNCRSFVSLIKFDIKYLNSQEKNLFARKEKKNQIINTI